ncbi:MAG: YdcF family protein [Planctomycetota bacterium]
MSLVQWVCVALVTFAAAGVFTPVGDWLGDPLIRTDDLAASDAIVVLGGDLARGVEAARLYREGWGPRVIVSSTGGNTDHLADVVAAYGVPREAILLDRKAFVTLDHGETVARLDGVDPGAQRFIVVTSPYHTARARACFRRAGYTRIIMRSTGWQTGGDLALPAGWTMRARELPTKLYEILAWAKYKLRGWL